MKAHEIEWPLVTRIKLKDGTQIPIAFGSAELNGGIVWADRADRDRTDDEAAVELEPREIAWVGRGGLASWNQIIGELVWTEDNLRMLAGEDIERWRTAEGVNPQLTRALSRAEVLEVERQERARELAMRGGEGRHDACLHPRDKKSDMNCRQMWRRRLKREFEEETERWMNERTG